MSAFTTHAYSINKLTEGAYLVCTPQGNILFGCPPEILKRIMVSHLPMPETVVLPETLHHYHSSQASLEFPLYHFLFVQRGLERKRSFQVIANKRQCKGLENLLRVTVVGPSDKEMVQAGLDKQRAKELFQETSHLALKNSDTGKVLTIPEIINFHALEPGDRTVLYPTQDKMPEVVVERLGPASFRIYHGEEAQDVDLTVTAEQTPNYQLHHKRYNADAGRFTVTVLGRSNGFDPNDPANGYLLNVDGKVILWDAPAYLHQHLKQLKLPPERIDAFILSHVHEDHIDVVESVRDGKPFDLYATPEVYYSLLVKLMAVYGFSMDEAKKRYKYHPIDVHKPMTICGAHFEFFHAVHAIPAIGARVTKKIGNKKPILHISGDHLAHAALDQMMEEGGIAKRRYDEAKGFLRGDESLVLMDAGGGLIHGDFHDYLDYPRPMAYMHTGLIQEELPKDQQLVKSGQVLDVLRNAD